MLPHVCHAVCVCVCNLAVGGHGGVLIASLLADADARDASFGVAGDHTAEKCHAAVLRLICEVRTSCCNCMNDLFNVWRCWLVCLFGQLSSVPEGRTYLGLQSDLLAQLLWKQVLMANASATQRANNALGIAADGVDDSGLASASRRWALVALQRLR